MSTFYALISFGFLLATIGSTGQSQLMALMCCIGAYLASDMQEIKGRLK